MTSTSSPSQRPYSIMKTKDKLKDSLDAMRYNLIEYYTNVLKTIIYLNSFSQSNGALVESISNLYNKIIKDSQEATEDESAIKTTNLASTTTPSGIQGIISILNYLKFTGFIDYYVDNMKKDKITITVSPVISAFLLQYYFEILNVFESPVPGSDLLKNPKHKEDEKILLLQKLFVASSLINSSIASGASQSSSADY
jgi:hypothetical protein